MNLKEAFRFQNKLGTLMDEAQGILGREANITKVENTYLRQKVYDGAENETVVDTPPTEFADRITDVVKFMMHLKGRFSYLALASSAIWQTVYELEGHLFSYEIRLSAINKTNIERTEKTEVRDASTGTTVTIPISDSKTNAELQYQKIKVKLLQEFAWYLYLHKDRHISIIYCGEELQYNDYINTELSRECTIDIEGH